MKTHYLRNDFRIDSLRLVMIGLENSISKLNEKCEEISWYKETFWDEEIEPIYGLAFIALQNYVNGSIYDLYKTLTDKEKKYKIEKIINQSGRTNIELIIGLANYFKHRDDQRDLRSGTSNILSDFDIKYADSIDVLNSPIFKGLDILSVDWRLSELIEIVQIWRESLWKKEENTMSSNT